MRTVSRPRQRFVITRKQKNVRLSLAVGGTAIQKSGEGKEARKVARAERSNREKP